MEPRLIRAALVGPDNWTDFTSSHLFSIATNIIAYNISPATLLGPPTASTGVGSLLPEGPP